MIGESEGCYNDEDCPSKHACFSGECLNPCLVIEPCVQNAECEVKDELPARVMVCTCRPGYSGKGDEHCDKISMICVNLARKDQIYTCIFYSCSSGCWVLF